MCLTVPKKVISVKNGFLEVQSGSSTERLTPSVKARKGDWLLCAGTRVVKKISGRDARDIIKLLESAPKNDLPKTSRRFRQILTKKNQLTKSDVVYLLKTTGAEKNVLLSEANIIRQANLKDFFCVHGIIEFSNYCQNDCAYCGLKKENNNLRRYRMTPAEIVNTAVRAAKKGYKLLVLQSGQDYFFSDETLCGILKKIKKRCKVFIFISIGERPKTSYAKFKKAGASGVLFRFETSNKKIFKQLHPNGKNYENRFALLDFMKKTGYFVATGSLVGLSGQKIADLARDIFEIKKYADMASIGPVVDIYDHKSPWSNSRRVEMNLKIIAILRLIMKKSKIPVVTAFETLAGDEAKKLGLQSGANSVMINLTPEKYRPLYQIYPNKNLGEPAIWEKFGLFNLPQSYKMLESRLKKEF